MTTLAASIVNEPRDGCRYPCDFCHAPGQQLFDSAWLCAVCVEAARERLRREEWATTGELRRKK
jgi:hypothetical protein